MVWRRANQTALSFSCSKKTRGAHQRQLGVGVLKGKVMPPGGRQAQSRSATRCQHVCLLHGDCKPNTVQGAKYHRRARNMSILPQSTGHSTWVLGTTDPVLSLLMSMLCPQVPCLANSWRAGENRTSYLSHYWFRQTLEGRWFN